MTEPRQDRPASQRRREAALAGHRGDEATARSLIADADAGVRATALGALGRIGRLTARDVEAGLADGSPVVRRRACEVAASRSDVDLVGHLGDPDPSVVEVAAWALGEQHPGASGASGDAALAAIVEALGEVARAHQDSLCRESAVAAIGAIGDPAGRAAVLDALTDRAPVRRRAVIALAAFDGPLVEDALRRALDDRDWQVRQAAEDLLGTAGRATGGDATSDSAETSDHAETVGHAETSDSAKTPGD